MKADCVVVIRLKNNQDILALILNEQEGTIRVTYPYYAKYDIGGNISIMPYCPLSSEIYFEFKRSDVDFVVTAAPDVSTKFLALIQDVEALDYYESSTDKSKSSNKPSKDDKSTSELSKGNAKVKGNETKH